jgi:hypothetical protein
MAVSASPYARGVAANWRLVFGGDGSAGGWLRHDHPRTLKSF